MMFSETTLHLAKKTIAALVQTGAKVITAESCTGGLIAAALTSVPGSSKVVHGGFVTYANSAKEQMLAVPGELIRQHGAVSGQVALAMAKGALAASSATIAIAVTGIAGPEGGTKEKPVGLVHIGLAANTKGVVDVQHAEHRFGDIGRAQVRMASVDAALTLLITVILSASALD